LHASATTLLSPFDPLVCDRARAKRLFDFDFSIECYLPIEKRTFGYFAMPVLSRGVLVGRVAAKAHRQEGVFEIRNFALEQNQDHPVNGSLAPDIAQAIQACAAWHETPQIKFSVPVETEFIASLQSACSA
jgi:uncharacterized protein